MQDKETKQLRGTCRVRLTCSKPGAPGHRDPTSKQYSTHAGQMTDTAHTQKSASNRAATSLTRFQRDCLAVIAGFETGIYDQGEYETYATPHGLAIKSALEKRYDEEVNHGRLYPNLDILIDDGLVEKEAVDQRTNGYKLTDEGRYILREHAQWLVGCLGGDEA